jgi:hypothetical protein
MIGRIIFSFALTLACAYSLVLSALLLGLFKVRRSNTKNQEYTSFSVSVVVQIVKPRPDGLKILLENLSPV